VKKVIISAGPIPGKLDSVKYITNRFKGGLAFKTAELLSNYFDITIIKWKYTDYFGKLKIINVDNVDEYYNFLLSNKFDAYILSAAVANLIPINPWKTKFPSHNYNENDEINIKFKIAPRIIDKIKQKYPLSSLIGYKLLDSDEKTLIDAGWKTLVESKANAIFCNTPLTAKNEKIMLLSDGSIHKLTFDEHIEKIKRIINLKWYSTKTFNFDDELDKHKKEFDELSKILNKIKIKKQPYEFGTVAYKLSDSILTTTRGKRENGFCKIYHINHVIKRIFSTHKATLNIPFIDLLFFNNSNKKIIIHEHKQLKNVETLPYIFDGTTECFNIINYIVDKKLTEFNIENHGYYKLFETLSDTKKYLNI